MFHGTWKARSSAHACQSSHALAERIKIDKFAACMGAKRNCAGRKESVTHQQWSCDGQHPQLQVPAGAAAPLVRVSAGSWRQQPELWACVWERTEKRACWVKYVPGLTLKKRFCNWTKPTHRLPQRSKHLSFEHLTTPKPSMEIELRPLLHC
jgi:hypothetical protein